MMAGKNRQPRPFDQRNKRSWTPVAQSTKDVAEAGRAITHAKYHGMIPRASALPCVSCHKQADDWHHLSYAPEGRLNVIPLCTSCHMRVHRLGLQLPPLGIVPTAVGLVRIAIATR